MILATEEMNRELLGLLFLALKCGIGGEERLFSRPYLCRKQAIEVILSDSS
jgi:hypothetical protein